MCAGTRPVPDQKTSLKVLANPPKGYFMNSKFESLPTWFIVSFPTIAIGVVLAIALVLL